MFYSGQKVVYIGKGENAEPNVIVPSDKEALTILEKWDERGSYTFWKLVEYPDQAFRNDVLRPIITDSQEFAEETLERILKEIHIDISIDVEEVILNNN